MHLFYWLKAAVFLTEHNETNVLKQIRLKSLVESLMFKMWIENSSIVLIPLDGSILWVK